MSCEPSTVHRQGQGTGCGGGLELPAPGMQDPGTTGEVGPEETLVFGEPFEGWGRGLAQGLVGEALIRAEEGAQGCRDGAREEEVRPGARCVQVVLEPLRGCMGLPLGAMSMTTGVRDTGVGCRSRGTERGGVPSVRVGTVG
jgi:hypothetical protein